MVSLLRLLHEHPCPFDEILIHGTDRTWTAAEMRAEVDRFASALRDRGVRTNEPVAVVDDGASMVLAMFGVWRAGAVFVPVNPRLPKPAVTDVVERTGSVATVTREGVLRTGTGGPMPPGSAFVLWT